MLFSGALVNLTINVADKQKYFLRSEIDPNVLL